MQSITTILIVIDMHLTYISDLYVLIFLIVIGAITLYITRDRANEEDAKKIIR